MSYDVLQDLSDLTTVPKTSIQSVFDKLMLIGSHDVVEQLENAESQTELDLYFGKLNILIEDEKIRYKFIPSKKFDRMLTEAVLTQTSPLTNTIELIVRDRLTGAYKELF